MEAPHVKVGRVGVGTERGLEGGGVVMVCVCVCVCVCVSACTYFSLCSVQSRNLLNLEIV